MFTNTPYTTSIGKLRNKSMEVARARELSKRRHVMPHHIANVARLESNGTRRVCHSPRPKS